MSASAKGIDHCQPRTLKHEQSFIVFSAKTHLTLAQTRHHEGALRAVQNQVSKTKFKTGLSGLDGADDYVVKPFSIEDLLARVRVHLPRTQETDPDLLQLENLRLNRRTREVFRGR